MCKPWPLFLPFCAFGLLSSIATASEQAAQENPAQTVDPVSEAIEEIVVTGLRRETPLQETALSIGVLTDEAIQGGRLRGLDDYWRQIPSMSVTDSGPFGTLAVIRGLSANFGASQNEPLSSIYLDETPLTNSGGYFTAPPDIYLVDMERVEVLRGPQGTLFGASSMGGTIRSFTRKPDPSKSNFSVETALSSTRHGGMNTEINAVFNQVLTPERSALRVAVYHRDDDGFVDDIRLGREDVNWERIQGLRLTASTLVGERLSLNAKVLYQDFEAGSYNEMDPNGKPEIGLPTSGDYQLALFSPEYRADEVILYNLEATYTTPAADWLSITSYYEHRSEYVIDIADEMNFVFGEYMPTALDGWFSQDVFMQEFRVVSNADGPVGWLAGMFYLDQEGPWAEVAPSPGFNNSQFCIDWGAPLPGAPYPTCTGYPDGEEYLEDINGSVAREDLGIYASVSYDIGDRWQAIIGGRWYDMRSSFEELLDGFWMGGFGFPPEAGDLADESGTTWSGSLAFRPGENTTVYGRAAQGFRQGGANEPGIFDLCTDAPDRYESDTLWSYEVGARTVFLNDRLVVNATAYHIDWNDAQVALFNFACANYYTANSGEASSRGLELEINAVINDNWSLLLSAGYTDAELDDGLDDPAVDAPAGTELPYVPDVTASLTSSHRFSIVDNLEGFTLLEAQHTGRSYSSLDLASRVELPSYTLVNLRAGVDKGEWSTEIFAENLLDEQAMFSCCRLNGEYVVNRPRTVGVRVSYGR